jgi:hypothetical protein
VKVAKVNGRTIATSASITGFGGTVTVPRLDQLTDVIVVGINDGDILIWDDATDTWLPGPQSAAIDVTDEGSSLTTAPTSIDFVGGGVTATAVGDDVTVTIPGGATATDAGIWRPLMDGAVPGTIILDGTTGEAIMAFGPA